MRVYQDQPYQLELTVRDLAGALVTPTTIDLRYLLPDGAQEAGPVPAVDSLGHYHADDVRSQVGPYRYRWLTTGPGAGVSVGTLVVADPFAPEITTLAGVKDQCNIGRDDTAHDEELADYLAALPAVVERWTGPLTPTARTQWVDRWPAVLKYTPVLELTSMSGVDVSTVDLDAEAGVVTPGPYSGYAAPGTVAYVSGYRSIPAALDLAGRVIVAHWWESQRAAGSGDVRGGDDYADANSVPGMGFALPRYAVELLESVRVSTGLR